MSSADAGTRVAERLYYDSPELAFRARVTDIRLVAVERKEDGAKEQLWQVALDRTAFYPESGGQPWDTGVVVATARSGATLEVAIERVEEDEATGEVWHFVRKPLVEGTEVEGRVDADRRRDHMQQHTGQHLLSAVFLERLGARTVSFHLGAESSTIDLLPPEGVAVFGAGELEGVEAEVNRLIFEDRPLAPRWHTREEAKAMLARGNLRKLPERSGPMRVVEICGVELNACGGTHAASTGAIGGLLLRRAEKVKQGWRVEFVCGLRAVRVARREYGVLRAVAGELSVGAADVPGRVAALQEESKAAGKALRAVLAELATLQAEELLRRFEQSAIVEATFEGRSVDFAKRVASVCAAAGRFAVIGSADGTTAALALAVPAGSGQHAGNLLREVFSAKGARGGGSADVAQGICSPDQVAALQAELVARLGASGTPMQR